MAARARQARFPLAPLIGASGAANTFELAGRAGIHRCTLQRWKTAGVPYWSADRLAASLGMHPCEVWPLFDTIHPTEGAPTP